MKPDGEVGELRVLADTHEVVRSAAEEVTRTALEVVAKRTPCTLAVSTGPVSRQVLALLAGDGDPSFRKRLPWNDLHVFWTDERLVPADHPESGYRAVRESLLSKVTLRSKQVHRVRTEGMTAEQAARELERDLRAFFGQILMLRYEVPRFDLVVLELGADGSVARLAPGSAAVREKRALASTVKQPAPAVTLTPVVFNLAANVVVLACGSDKAAALKAAREPSSPPEQSPAAALRPSEGRLLWLADRAAVPAG